MEDVIVVPHTHWDREWFETAESFRFHLVSLMDDLLDTLENDPAIPCFLLDGQMSMAEDYFLIRPENRTRFEALARAGRITLGPWYVQPDEFLVSGESLARNLAIGIDMAKEFGEPMREGYVPDTFGHIQNLPMILNGFGIDTFYTMRGFGGNLDETGTEFLWKSPDGSSVATHFIAESYSNAAMIGPTKQTTSIHHGKTVTYENLDELLMRMRQWARIPARLLLNGSDHTALQEHLSENIASLAKEAPVRLGTLSEFGDVLRAKKDSFAHVEGEFRFGRYMPVLKEVMSSRVYLKQMNTEAENALLLAERCASLSLAAGLDGYGALLQYGWKRLLKNHAHDSICGCSIDGVNANMPYRFQAAIDNAEKIIERTVEDFSIASVDPAEVLSEDSIPVAVFNPSPWERSGKTSVSIVPLKNSPLGKRIFGYSVPERDFSPEDLTLFDGDGNPVPFTIGESAVKVRDVLLRRKVLFEDTISFCAERVPPLGCRIYHAKIGAKNTPDNTPEESASYTLSNGILALTVGRNGLISVFDAESGAVFTGLNEFVDEADAGDEYSFSPLPNIPPISSADLNWRIARYENSVTARAEFLLPEEIGAGRTLRSAKTVACAIETTVTLEAGEKLVRIKTVFENCAKDHRLRARFPTKIRTSESIAETAFGVIRRPVECEPCEGWREAASGNYVQKRFVMLKDGERGFALFNKGLPEYEVRASGDIFLTLLRAVGWLSRGDLPLRPGQVGPELPTPLAQCLGVHTFEYAFMLMKGDDEKDVWKTAEELAFPLRSCALQTARQLHEDCAADFLRTGFLSIDNPNVVLSALIPDNGAVVMRVFNPHPAPAEFSVKLSTVPKSVTKVTLGGDPVGDVAVTADGFTDIIQPFALASYRWIPPRQTPAAD